MKRCLNVPRLATGHAWQLQPLPSAPQQQHFQPAGAAAEPVVHAGAAAWCDGACEHHGTPCAHHNNGSPTGRTSRSLATSAYADLMALRSPSREEATLLSISSNCSLLGTATLAAAGGSPAAPPAIGSPEGGRKRDEASLRIWSSCFCRCGESKSKVHSHQRNVR